MVPAHLRPYVKLVWDRRALERAMPLIHNWITGSPVTPWLSVPALVPDPLRFASTRLGHMIEEG
jgi:hypothetical protein